MIDHDDRNARLAWLRANAQHGYAGRPGASPGQPFQPGAITGGLEGPTVRVSTLAGLRAALDAPGPAWIVWERGEKAVSMSDRLTIRRDNKTLFGLGLSTTGRGVRVDRAMNVIVHGICCFSASGDGFEVSESRVVAIVDCAAVGFHDGGIDIVRGSTDVLVRGCSVMGSSSQPRKGCLIGSDDKPHARQFTGSLGHLGLLDDRQTRVTMQDCLFSGVAVRAPLARHGRVVLEDHRIIGGGKGPMVEARTNARILWASGRVDRLGDRPAIAASHTSQDTVTRGQLYVAPAVNLGGSTVQTNWRPTTAEALDMLRMP